MTHAEFVTTVLSIHSGILMASLAAFYKFGDRPGTYTNPAQEARFRLRRRIAENLRSALRPVFEKSDLIEVSAIVNTNGDPWDAKQVNPAGGEEYRNALGSFLDGEGDVIADYRSMRIASSRLEYMLCLRSWLTLFTVAWQLTSICVVGLLEKLILQEMNETILIISLLPTGLAAFLFLFFCGSIMWLHDNLNKLSKQYD